MTDPTPGDTAPEVRPCIYEVRHYRDHQGHNLVENVLIEGDALPPGLSRFMGQAFVRLQIGPQVQDIPVPPFPVEADSVIRAFGLFEGVAIAAATEFKQKLLAQQRRIMPATPQQAGRILGSDGNFL